MYQIKEFHWPHFCCGFQDCLQPVPCPVCHKSYSQKYNLRRHIETVHMGLKKFQCPVCSKAFPAKRNMDDHMCRKHKYDKHYVKGTG